ncbi:MAG: ABC transporter substrate-binding protein [Thioalkalivibrio sp.]|nr:ABC transporter substrate-binding protein [Thioalkalivibrio sp.]
MPNAAHNSTRVALILVTLSAALLAGFVSAQERRFVVAQSSSVNSWDPPADWMSEAEWIVMNTYDCLVFPDRETGEVVGWLAESWDLVDPVTWRLDLRQGVTFHNGEPFTAEDAAYSIDRILGASRQEFIVYDQWQFVERTEVIDEHTLDIITREPDPAFLSRLSGTGCGVVSKDYVEEFGNEHLANNPMGTGPFIVEEYDRASFVLMVANEEYWGGRPEIDELIFRAIPESSTRVAELLTGGVDLALSVPPQDWERIEARDNLEMLHYTTDRVWGLSLAHAPAEGIDAVATSIPEVREAINLAIDREELNDLVGGFGVPTLTRLTPPIPCSAGVDGSLYDVNPFDPERAAELLASVGYPDVPGAELTLHSAFGQGVAHRDIAETIASMLEDVGFVVNLDIRDLTNFRETVYQDNPGGIMLQTLGNFTTDPWLFVLNYDSKFGERAMPRNRFSDETLDTMAVQIESEMDPEVRCELVVEYAERVHALNASVELLQQPESLGISSAVSWTPPTDGNFMLLNLRYR